MKYRKKPVVIEAFQMTKEHRWDNSEWPNWLNQAWNREPSDVNSFYYGLIKKENLFIHTLEGTHKVTFGDYIIQGIKGELYLCKPDIFEESYEAL